MLQGVLFDMDGVLVDSECFICKAAVEMFEEKGLTVKKEDFIPFVGTGENRYIGGVAEKYNFPINIEQVKARTYEIYEKIVKNKIQALPGAKEFIERCRQKSLKLALVTSADEVKMLINLKEIGIPTSKFDVLINGLDVERKKPFPDIYLKAAGELGLKPENCLVVEDAVSGVNAAKAAGMRCLALLTSFNEKDLIGSDWIIQNLKSAPEEVLNW